MIKLSILEDHPIVVKGICNLFEQEDDIVIDRIWNNGDSFFLDMEKGIVPELLLMDVLLPDRNKNGDTVIRVAKKLHPEIKILAMSVLEGAISANTMLRLGANGYIKKSASVDEWTKAVRLVAEGGTYIEPELNAKIQALKDGRTKEASVKTTLTVREQQVLQQIAMGYSKKEIGRNLGLSTNTVKQYQYNISLKLEVNNTAALVRHALLSGLVE